MLPCPEPPKAARKRDAMAAGFIAKPRRIKGAVLYKVSARLVRRRALPSLATKMASSGMAIHYSLVLLCMLRESALVCNLQSNPHRL